MNAREAKAILAIVEAIREAVEAAGPSGIPSGHLYAMLMPHGIDFPTYERLLNILIDAKRVSRDSSHLLKHVPFAKESA